MRPSPDSVLRRADVLWRRTSGAVLVRPRAHGEVVKLTASGVALWDALAGEPVFSELCDELAAAHSVAPDTVAADLAEVIDDLSRRGLIRVG